MDWRVTVSNLFKKAEDPATTPEERKALSEKAAYLMEKYGISELVENVTKPMPSVTNITVILRNPHKNHRSLLISGIARAFGARTVRLTNEDKVIVFGMPEDIQRFSTMFASLWIQANLSLAASEKPAHVHGKTHAYNYLLGFVNEVNNRVRAATKKAASDSTSENVSTALVLANRSNAVNDAVSAMFPKLVPGRRLDTTNSRSYGAGVEAGRSADIGQQRVGRSATPRKALT